jgi:hypothetical protein
MDKTLITLTAEQVLSTTAGCWVPENRVACDKVPHRTIAQVCTVVVTLNVEFQTP